MKMRELRSPVTSSDGSSRRRFLRQVGAAAAAAWIQAAGGAEEKAMPAIPIVDTHEHLWDLEKVRLPWLQSAEEVLRHSYVTKDYVEATAGLNVVKAVYMEVDVAADCKLAEAKYVLEICQRGDTPMVAAVIGGYPAAEDFRQYITQFKGSRYIKGVRQIVGEAGMFADAGFRRGIGLLGEVGMSFDLCHSPQMLLDAARFVDACPGTRFILDHCGNADVKWFMAEGKDQADARQRWRRDIGELARRKNVVCKISGIVASAPKGRWTADDLAPIVNHCIEVFGPDRVMFAGDWPVCTRVATFREWVGALKQIVGNRLALEQRKLFHDNAVGVYGLA